MKEKIRNVLITAAVSVGSVFLYRRMEKLMEKKRTTPCKEEETPAPEPEETPEVSETPEVQEVPETAEVPENPEVQEVPEAPEVQETAAEEPQTEEAQPDGEHIAFQTL